MIEVELSRAMKKSPLFRGRCDFERKTVERNFRYRDVEEKDKCDSDEDVDDINAPVSFSEDGEDKNEDEDSMENNDCDAESN